MCRLGRSAQSVIRFMGDDMTDITKQAEDALVGVTLKKFSPTSDSQMPARLVEAGLYDDDLCYRAEEVDEKFADLIAHARAQEAELVRLREALTPSGNTKAEYSGEFSISVYDGEDENGGEQWRKVLVDWTTIKAIMAAIKARAALTPEASHDR